MNEKIRAFFQGGAPEDAGVAELEKAAMANGSVLVGVVVMMALSVVDAVTGDARLAIVLAAVSGLLVVLLVLNHRYRKYELVVTAGVILVGLAFLYFLVSGGGEGHAFVWYFIFPLFAMFLLGSRKGVVISLMMSLAAGIYFVVDPLVAGWPDYDAPFEARFTVAYLVVTFFAFLFQRLKENSYRLVSIQNKRLRRAKDTAQSASRAKSEFLANMSHEFRTPLNHILGFTELLHDAKAGPVTATQKEYLGDVLRSGKHLLSLINDVLDMSKIEAGKMELELSDVELEPLVHQSAQMVRERARKQGITVSVEVTTEVREFRADARKLSQILYNLLSNAVKFNLDGGSVTVTVTDNDDRSLRFSVSDTGIGIADENLQKIFQPFDQVRKAAGHQYQGTGLGLSLTRSLVELHGGKIWVESPGLNMGTTFFFTLSRDPTGTLKRE